MQMELANLKAKAAEAATAEEDGKEKDHVDDYVKDYARLFFSTVGTVCASEAPDTPWLSSSPSNGRYSWQQADLAVIAEDPNSEAFGVTRVTVGDGTEEDDDNLEDTWLSFFYPGNEEEDNLESGSLHCAQTDSRDCTLNAAYSFVCGLLILRRRLPVFCPFFDIKG